MSFTSIRCPNCAGTESVPIGESKYQCRYCDNTFDYVAPNAPKVTKHITVQEIQSHNCPNCGRGITAGTSNRCMECGISDFCSNCIIITPEQKFVCKNCLLAASRNCSKCGKYAVYRCPSCLRLHEKDPSHVIVRTCADPEHFIDHFVKMSFGSYMVRYCSDCYLKNISFSSSYRILISEVEKAMYTHPLCKDCVIGGFRPKCQSCNNHVSVIYDTRSDLIKKLEKFR